MGKENNMSNKIFHSWMIGVALISSAMAEETYQWGRVAVGGGGFVTGIVFSEAAKNLVYCRTDVGGALRWDSQTQSWIQLLDWIGAGQGSLADVESIAADPLDSNRVYIVGGEGDLTRVMRSIDRGNSFQLIDPGFKVSGNGDGRGKSERLMIDPNSTNILFYGTRSAGLYKSSDYGSTWSKVAGFPVSTTTDGVGIVSIIFDTRNTTKGTPTQVMFANVSQKGNSLYKSINGGTSWQLVAGSSTTLQPIDAGMDSQGILYISYSDGPGPNGIGAGAVWKFNTDNSAWTSINPPTGQGGFGGLAVDKKNPGTVMVGTVDRWSPHDEVYRTIDGGTTWSRIDDYVSRDASDAPYEASYGAPSAGNWIYNMRFDPFNSNHVMYVTGAGVWASSDVNNIDSKLTTHWKFLVKGIEEGGAYEMISPPTGAPLLSVFGDIGGFRHLDITVAPLAGFFKPPGWGTGNGIDFAQSNPNKVVRTYLSGTNGAYSNDNGVTWTAFAASPPTSGNYGDYIAISPNGINIVWALSIYQQNAPPYYSNNNGATWTQSNVPNLGTSAYFLRSDRVNSNRFYLYATASGTVYTSTDGGANYTAGATIQKWGQRIATNPWKEGEVWVPVYDGLYFSTNSGQSFTKLTNVLNVTSVSLGKAAPTSNFATVFVQATVNGKWGFYRSIDQGQTWVRINDDQHQYGYPGSSFLVADQGVYGRMYYSTHCMGITYGEIQAAATSSSSSTISSSGTSSSVTTSSSSSATVQTLQQTDSPSATLLPGNQIRIALSGNEWNSIMVYNTLGKMVYSRPIFGLQLLEIPVHKSGIYILKLSSISKVQVMRANIVK